MIAWVWMVLSEEDCPFGAEGVEEAMGRDGLRGGGGGFVVLGGRGS